MNHFTSIQEIEKTFWTHSFQHIYKSTEKRSCNMFTKEVYYSLHMDDLQQYNPKPELYTYMYMIDLIINAVYQSNMPTTPSTYAPNSVDSICSMYWRNLYSYYYNYTFSKKKEFSQHQLYQMYMDELKILNPLPEKRRFECMIKYILSIIYD